MSRNKAAVAPESDAPTPSKLTILEALLARPEGASITDMTTANGWQQHSVRGALAGALKKRGHVITSEKVDGTRRYRSDQAAR